jgi:hypothetical protein
VQRSVIHFGSAQGVYNVQIRACPFVLPVAQTIRERMLPSSDINA